MEGRRASCGRKGRRELREPEVQFSSGRERTVPLYFPGCSMDAGKKVKCLMWSPLPEPLLKLLRWTQKGETQRHCGG